MQGGFFLEKKGEGGGGGRSFVWHCFMEIPLFDFEEKKFAYLREKGGDTRRQHSAREGNRCSLPLRAEKGGGVLRGKVFLKQKKEKGE